MKNNDLLSGIHRNTQIDYHIGSLIKEVARQKGVSAKQIADTIRLYQNNAEKIFKRDDMDVADVVKISYLLEHHFLKDFSEKFLSHLPVIKSQLVLEKFTITLNLKTKRYDLHGNTGSYEFLEHVHFGAYIQKLAKQNRWNEQSVADRLNCSQSTVSDLYNRKSVQLKKIVQLSNVFQHHILSALYLSNMMIIPPLKMIDQCKITVIDDNICLSKLTDIKSSIIFRP